MLQLLFSVAVATLCVALVIAILLSDTEKVEPTSSICLIVGWPVEE